MKILLVLILLFGIALPNLASECPNVRLVGTASWYGPGFHGRKAADGSTYDMWKMTCAHKTLKFGTKLKVVNKQTGKSCIVVVTDRGPYIPGRIIDLSKAAAIKTGVINSGIAMVEAVVVQ